MVLPFAWFTQICLSWCTLDGFPPKLRIHWLAGMHAAEPILEELDLYFEKKNNVCMVYVKSWHQILPLSGGTVSLN